MTSRRFTPSTRSRNKRVQRRADTTDTGENETSQTIPRTTRARSTPTIDKPVPVHQADNPMESNHDLTNMETRRSKRIKISTSHDAGERTSSVPTGNIVVQSTDHIAPSKRPSIVPKKQVPTPDFRHHTFSDTDPTQPSQRHQQPTVPSTGQHPNASSSPPSFNPHVTTPTRSSTPTNLEPSRQIPTSLRPTTSTPHDRNLPHPSKPTKSTNLPEVETHLRSPHSKLNVSQPTPIYERYQPNDIATDPLIHRRPLTRHEDPDPTDSTQPRLSQPRRSRNQPPSDSSPRNSHPYDSINRLPASPTPPGSDTATTRHISSPTTATYNHSAGGDMNSVRRKSILLSRKALRGSNRQNQRATDRTTTPTPINPAEIDAPNELTKRQGVGHDDEVPSHLSPRTVSDDTNQFSTGRVGSEMISVKRDDYNALKAEVSYNKRITVELLDKLKDMKEKNSKLEEENKRLTIEAQCSAPFYSHASSCVTSSAANPQLKNISPKLQIKVDIEKKKLQLYSSNSSRHSWTIYRSMHMNMSVKFVLDDVIPSPIVRNGHQTRSSMNIDLYMTGVGDVYRVQTL